MGPLSGCRVVEMAGLDKARKLIAIANADMLIEGFRPRSHRSSGTAIAPATCPSRRTPEDAARI